MLVAGHVKVSFGSVPGPAAVWAQAEIMWDGYRADRAAEAEFYVKQAEKKKVFLAQNPGGEWHERKYSGAPTYVDQIFTSLKTVFAGFLIAAVIAVPLGIVCGLSKVINQRDEPVHPVVQAGVAARVAAHRDDHGQRALQSERPDV